jgi:DNA-binding NarL/FixJ family response regulator
VAETTRAVVIEGVPLVRAGISSVLRDQHVAVVAEASSMIDAATLVRGADAHLLVVGDDDGSGLAEAIKRVKERTDDVLVVALVSRCSREVLLGILDAGADAIVPHDVDRDQLVTALDAVRAGEHHIGASITSILFASVTAADAVRPVESSPLTPREESVMRLLAEGCTNDEISQRLFISPATVKTHLSNVYAKLGARNRYDAVVKSTQRGIL